MRTRVRRRPRCRPGRAWRCAPLPAPSTPSLAAGWSGLISCEPMTRSNYGALDRLLHRLALGSDAVADLSFDLENALHPTKGDEDGAQQRPVFVTGLARAGTTLLMRLLYATGAFCSLTYRDM